MAELDRHHDLVVCLIAVEQKLITAEALAPMLKTWLDQPTASLGQLLVEERFITANQQAQLDKLATDWLADGDFGATSMWKTLPPLLQSTLMDPLSTPVTMPEHVENTRDLTAAHAAPIVGGKNDERFNIVAPYAQGGLGEVSVAHDTQLGRMVALKQIKTRWADDVDARSRFLQEAQITGRLEHPGIVPVYALGFDASGRPYYAMRFIEGETLQEVVKRFHAKFPDPQADHGERLLELRKLLGRLVDVCNAIDYAHNRGIIHRDLKPANIMLGRYGETLVVDWGLAKVIGGDKLPPLPFREIAATGSGLTGTVMGAAIGTPAYMSPEQAAGRTDQLTSQTDIYSLGVTLYHLLTGRLPYEEESVSGVLEKIQSSLIQSPRHHSRWIPRPLEAICMKAMAPRADDRYPSTAALADDIERWLADEPIAAHEAGFVERTSRWLRHHRTFAMSFFVANVLGMIAILAGTYLWNQMQEDKFRHQLELQQQDRQRLAQAQSAADAAVQSAGAELLAGRFPAARDFLKSALATLNSDERLTENSQPVGERLARIDQIVEYYQLAEAGEEMSVAQRDTESQLLIQQALNSLGVFDHADWWAHLPTADLTAAQVDALREDIYLKLNLLIALYSKSMHLHVASFKGENDARRVLVFNDMIQRYRPAEFARWYAAFSRFRLRRGPTIDVSQLGEPLNAPDAFAKGVMYAVGADYEKLTGAFANEDEDLRLLSKRHLELAAQMNPNHYWTHYMLGYVELARAEHEKDLSLAEHMALFASARRAFAQCITLRSDYWRSYAERVLSYQRQIELVRAADPDEAALHLPFIPEWLRLMSSDAQHVVDLKPNDWLAHWYHGLALRTTGEIDYAIAEFLTALRLSENFAASADQQLISERELGILPDSVKLADQVLANKPDNSQALLLLAMAKLGLKEDATSLAAVERAITSTDPPPAAWTIRGQLRLNSKEYGAASKDFQHALEADPTDVAALMGLARVQLEREEHAAALETFERAGKIATVPEHQAAAEMARAEVLFRLKRFDESVQAVMNAHEVQASSDILPLVQLARDAENADFIRELTTQLTLAGEATVRATNHADAKQLPLLNGDFELGLARYWGNATSDGYVWQNHGGCDSRARISHEKPHEGSAALHITRTSVSAPGVTGTTSQTLPVEVTGKCRLTLWAKADNLSANALQIVFNNHDAEPLVSLPQGDFDWRQFSGEFDIKSDAGRRVRGLLPCTVQIISMGPGTVWLDDIAIERIGDAAPSPQE
jgi:serine/threonine protein kinase/Flp pilus assembly protein TadD